MYPYCESVVEKQEFSWKRNLDFFIMGFTYIAPALHLWYCKLLPRIQTRLFSTVSKATRVLGSMCCEQLVFAPIVMSLFFPLNQMVTDRSLGSFRKGVRTFEEKIEATMLANWKLWPIASTINIWFMPIQYQVLYSNFVGIFWNMIVSSIASKEKGTCSALEGRQEGTI
jgi:hypothetical protein